MCCTVWSYFSVVTPYVEIVHTLSPYIHNFSIIECSLIHITHGHVISLIIMLHLQAKCMAETNIANYCWY